MARGHKAWHGVVGATAVGWLLACGGLFPADLEDIDVVDDLGEHVGQEPEPKPEPQPPTPEELFAQLDGGEEAMEGAPACPKGASVIRHPRGGFLNVYCATHAGKKQGVWTKWRRSALIETATYVDGVQEGRATTWSTDDDGPVKRSESMWVAGVLEGDHAEWDDDGTLLVRGVYSAGGRDGRFIERVVGETDTTFAGVCYAAGEETWRTDDPVAFVTDPCGDDDPDEDEVATLR